MLGPAVARHYAHGAKEFNDAIPGTGGPMESLFGSPIDVSDEVTHRPPLDWM
jgi:hypothetical protein